MGKAIVMMVLVAGCGAQGLPNEQPQPVAVTTMPTVCVWHFLQPNDTADSMQIAGVSNCDAHSFHLADGAVTVDIAADGSVTAPGFDIAPRAKVGGDFKTYWYAEIDDPRLSGTITVDLAH